MTGLVAMRRRGKRSRQGQRGLGVPGYASSVEEVMGQFDVTREQISAALEFVARRLKDDAGAGFRNRPCPFSLTTKWAECGCILNASQPALTPRNPAATPKWTFRSNRTGAVVIPAEPSSQLAGEKRLGQFECG